MPFTTSLIEWLDYKKKVIALFLFLVMMTLFMVFAILCNPAAAIAFFALAVPLALGSYLLISALWHYNYGKESPKKLMGDMASYLALQVLSLMTSWVALLLMIGVVIFVGVMIGPLHCIWALAASLLIFGLCKVFEKVLKNYKDRQKQVEDVKTQTTTASSQTESKPILTTEERLQDIFHRLELTHLRSNKNIFIDPQTGKELTFTRAEMQEMMNSPDFMKRFADVISQQGRKETLTALRDLLEKSLSDCGVERITHSEDQQIEYKFKIGTEKLNGKIADLCTTLDFLHQLTENGIAGLSDSGANVANELKQLIDRGELVIQDQDKQLIINTLQKWNVQTVLSEVAASQPNVIQSDGATPAAAT